MSLSHAACRNAIIPVMTGILMVSAVANADPCISAAEHQYELKNANKLVAAKRELVVCSQKTCGDRIAPTCLQWLAEVEAALPTVVVEAHDESGLETSRARVTVDGELLAETLDGTALAVDPGTHQFRFEIPGSSPEDRQIVIRVGEKNRKLVVSFQKAAPLVVSA